MRELNFDNKFKMRDPRETVKIIKDFFAERDYEIREIANIHVPYSDTWWCAIELYKSNVLILHANGKGITKAFSRASGYAELYERFCWRSWSYDSIIRDIFYEKTMHTLNYIDATDEILVNIDTVDLAPYYLDNLRGGISEYLKLKSYNNKLPLSLYKQVYSKNSKYLSDILISTSVGTNGLAAGNTFEEAYVQATSEIFERGVNSYLVNDKKEEFVIISNNDDLINTTNKAIIKKLQNNEFKILIFDFSYTYNLPVVGIIISSRHKSIFSIGAHPDFNIALERCFTETFQGKLFKDSAISIPQLEKYDGDSNSSIRPSYSWGLQKYIPEKILLQNKYDKPSKIWSECNTLEKQVSFCNKYAVQNGLTLYYKNISLSENMSAVRVYCPELKKITRLFNRSGSKTREKTINDNECTRFFTIGKTLLEDIIFRKNKNYLLEGFSDISQSIKFDDEFKFIAPDAWLSAVWFDLSKAPLTQMLQILDQINSNDLRLINSEYLLTYKYLFCNLYSYDEIKKILRYYDIDIDVDKLNIYDRNEVVYNLLISRIREIIELYINEIIPDYIYYQQEYAKSLAHIDDTKK